MNAVPSATIAGIYYPEQVLAAVPPSFYEENGEPTFGFPEAELEPGDQDYDPRIVDGDVMNYLRTELVVPNAPELNVLGALEITVFVVAWFSDKVGGGTIHPNVAFDIAALMQDVANECRGKEIELPPFCDALTDSLFSIWCEGGNVWDADAFEGNTRWVPVDEPLSSWCPDALKWVTEPGSGDEDQG